MSNICSYRCWQHSVPFCYKNSEGQAAMPPGSRVITGFTGQWCQALSSRQEEVGQRGQRKEDTYSSWTFTLKATAGTGLPAAEILRSIHSKVQRWNEQITGSHSTQNTCFLCAMPCAEHFTHTHTHLIKTPPRQMLLLPILNWWGNWGTEGLQLAWHIRS